MEQADRLYRAALAYAEAGLPVFPLLKLSKHPAVSRGFHAASTDPFQIGKWWKGKQAGGNIGYAIPRGVLIIDVDVRDGKQGGAAFDRLQSQYGVLPATRQATTASGGMHFYFRVPDDGAFKKELVPDCIDLKGAGGYVLLPPSGLIVPTPAGRSKQEYTWDGLDGFAAPIAELPAAWLAVCRKPASLKSDGAGERSRVGSDDRPAELPAIVQGCAWLRHTRDDAATLAEPEWYAMLSVLTRTNDGRATAHAWSKPHRTYTPADTDKKLDHAATGAGPVTCARVEQELGGGDFCPACPHHGKITSPIVLGNPSTTPPALADQGDWTGGLLRNKKGNVVPNVANAELTLDNHNAWSGHLVHNTFADVVELLPGAPDGIPPGRWDDRRHLETLVWLQRNLTAGISEGVARSAVELVARRHPVNPVQDRVRRDAWDGTRRLQEHFWQRYAGVTATEAKRAGAHDDHSLYLDHVAVFWFVSAAARLFKPGCRVDHFLTLDGPAYEKRRFLDAVAGRAVGVLGPKLDTPATLEGLRAAWILEVAESSLYEPPALREFLTRRQDRQKSEFWRPAYGRVWQSLPRQNVFVLTAPDAAQLFDDGGTWRLWPVELGTVDYDALQRDAPQLWAEALILLDQGTKWAPDKLLWPVFRREQRARRLLDPLTLRIDRYAEAHLQISLLEMLDAFNVPAAQQTATLGRRAARILHARGYRQQADDGAGVYWVDLARAAQYGTVIQ